MAKRRANGDGSITKLPSGKYRLRRTVEIDGIEMRKSITSTSPTACKKAFDEWMTSEHKVAIERVKTVRQWAAHWLEIYKIPSVSWKVGQDYKMYVEKHILPAMIGNKKFGDLKLEDVRPAHIAKLMAGAKNRKGGKLSLSAMRYIKYALQGIFETALGNRLCSTNPASKIELPEEQEKEIVIFTKGHMESIIKYLDEHEYGPYIAILLFTGLRIGEMLALMWAEVDNEERIMRICRRLVETKGGEIVGDGTKTRRIRHIAYGETLQRFLSKLPQTGLYVIPREQEVTDPKTGDQKKVITHHTHDSFNVFYYKFFDDLNEKITQDAAELSKQTGKEVEPKIIPRLTPHKCRHTFATYSIRSGIDQSIVQKQLGHTSVKTTEIYTHVDVEDLKTNVSKLDFK